MIWPDPDIYGRAFCAAIPFAKTAPVNRELTIRGQTPGDAPVFDQLSGPNWVYVFRDLSADPKVTRDNYDDLRPVRNKNPLFLARRNPQPSSVLYVGSTRKSGIARRLTQHVSSPPQAQTYALKLNLWFKGDYEILLRQYDFEGMVLPKDVDKALVLQIIEDSIAHQLQPAFGKRGPNASG